MLLGLVNLTWVAFVYTDPLLGFRLFSIPWFYLESICMGYIESYVGVVIMSPDCRCFYGTLRGHPFIWQSSLLYYWLDVECCFCGFFYVNFIDGGVKVPLFLRGLQESTVYSATFHLMDSILYSP